MRGAGLLVLAPALMALTVLGAEQLRWVEPRLGLAALGVLTLCQALGALYLLRMAKRREALAREAAAEAAEALAACTARMQRQTELLATAAHEIRTPLGGVLGLLDQVLAAPAMPSAPRQDAAVARQAAADLMILLRDMISAPEGTRPDEVFRIDELIDQVVALMRGRAAQQGTSLATAVAPGTPPAWVGDPQRLRQVVTNLVANAIRSTSGGVVRIEVREGAGQGLEVAIADTGRGIATERLPTLFDRFQPSDGGSGLGLSICRDLVAQMKGKLTVTSATGRGSVFTIALPLPQASLSGGDGQGAATAWPHAPTVARSPEEALPVLVVDDVAVNRRLIGTVLDRAGLAHVGVGSGQEALELLGRRRWRAVLMDLQMPEMDGFEATRRIRALPGDAGRTPVLAVTAQDDQRSRAEAAAAGMNGFLLKPVALAELEAMLRDLPAQG